VLRCDEMGGHADALQVHAVDGRRRGAGRR
jgi:hypothetical protein